MTNHLSVTKIKEKLVLIKDETDNFLMELLHDSRKSVQSLAKKQINFIQKSKKENQAHQKRLEIENKLYCNPNIQYIAGIDEVGRGPLAGPVVTAAVILPRTCDELIGVNDSKQLSHSKRIVYAQLIEKVALDIQINVCDVSTIDSLNIYQATRQSMLEAVNQLSLHPDYLLIDAMQIDSDIPQLSLIKGDQRSLSIAAASIIAKVYRDNLMIEYAKQYPEFGFDSHMGYGTKQHLEALKLYGYTSIHRRSFAPISTMTQLYQK